MDIEKTETLVQEIGTRSQSEALYTQSAPAGKACANCRFYQAGNCQVVEGEISPEGSCSFWVNHPQPVQETEPVTEPAVQEVEAVEAVQEQHLSQSSMQCLSDGLLRIPVAQKGKYHHSAYGTVEFNDQDFDDIIKNFEDSVLGFEPYVTYGHLIDPKVSVDAELKKGKAKQFEVEDDVLYVITEPTPDTLELAQSGEYEYSSGEFIRNYKDKITGENRGTVLMRYALTNSPFIPFNDKKIEVLESLSETNKDCPHSVINFMIKLSSDSGNIENLITNEDSTQIMEEQNQAPETEAPAVESVQVSEEIKPTQATPVQMEEATQTPAVETPATPAPAAPAYDLSKIIEQVTTQVSSLYQEQIKSVKEQAQQTVDALKAEIAGLNTKLTTQEATVQAFSTSMSNAQRQTRYQALAAQGVPTAFIQRFSELEGALETGAQVIKLSNTAGEVQEKSLTEAIAAILIDALHAEPVQVEQFGQSVSTVAANALTADMMRLVEANKGLAQKKTLG